MVGGLVQDQGAHRAGGGPMHQGDASQEKHLIATFHALPFASSGRAGKFPQAVRIL
jgi:hypothetical protein